MIWLTVHLIIFCSDLSLRIQNQSTYTSGSHEELYEKVVLRNFLKVTGKQACNFIKNETLVQAFSYEFCEIPKNTFFIEHLCWLLLYSENKHFNLQFYLDIHMLDSSGWYISETIIVYFTDSVLFFLKLFFYLLLFQVHLS